MPLAPNSLMVASVAGFSHSARPNCDWKLIISLSGESPSASRSSLVVFEQWQ